MKFTAVAFTLLTGLVCVTSAGIRVKAPLGGNATVVCPYQKGNEGYPKYFSKQRPGERIVTVRSHQVRTWSTDGRFSLEDDQERSEFTVIIRNLSVEDAGLYWCGVDWWRPDYLIEVNLDVVKVQIPPSSPTFSPQNASLSTRMRTEPHHLQKTNDNKTPGETVKSDQYVYLGVSLAVVVLLCGITTAVFILIKKNNVKRSTDFTQPRTCNPSNRDIDIYEEITPSAAGSSAIITHSPDCETHPESVIYSVITRPKKKPPDDPTPPPSAEPASIYYASITPVQSSHRVRDSHACAGKSCDLYTIVQHHSDHERSSTDQQMASVSYD